MYVAIPLLSKLSDNCDDSITFVLEENSTQGANPDACEYYNYTITRTWTASDACGNIATETQVLTVKDTEAPDICCNNIEIQLDENGEASFELTDLYCGDSDNCSDVTFSADNIRFDLNDIGQNNVTLTVSDACGNVDQCDAIVAVQKFDLALRKELATGEDARVYTGEEVTFTITVFNQGTIPASNIEVTDYVPTGFQLADSDWTQRNNGTIFTVLPGSIAPSASATVDITLKVISTTQGNLVNRAEISKADAPNGFTNTDVDSSPDATEGNDVGGEVNTSTDDLITDDGTIDEDDEDPEDVALEIFDLALRKTLADGEDRIVYPGETITFTIEVFNQGTVSAKNIVVQDYVPNGLSPTGETTFTRPSI